MTLPSNNDELALIRTRLASWFRENRREMPWRMNRNPYHIWISEIMLQQTRVDQATPYFNRFIERFPDVETLALAKLDDVLKAWEGLGYYSRARNIHAAAKLIVEKHDGTLPNTHDELLALPGVGPYTSAAIGSIAFGLPLAALDGNVIRVMARFFGVSDDTRKSSTRRQLQELADEFLDAENPGQHNEAVMELGATICKPSAPDCDRCPISNACFAFANGKVSELPFVSNKAAIPTKEIVIGIVSDPAGRYLIQRRPNDAMLGGLWEFPGGKVESGESHEAACIRELKEELDVDIEIAGEFHRLKHAYSHFKINLRAYRCAITSGNPKTTNGEPMKWVTADELENYAFPKANKSLVEAILSESGKRPGDDSD